MLEIRTTESIYYFTVIIYYILTYFSEKQLSQNKENSAFVLYDTSVLSVGLNRMQLDSQICFCIQFVNSCFIEIHEDLAHTYMSLEKGGMV